VGIEPFHELRIAGKPTTEHIDFRSLDNHRMPDGGAFPGTYRHLIRRIGWGRMFGLWMIYPPVLPGYADGWHNRASVLTEHFRTAYRDGRDEDFDWMIEPDGDWMLPASLTVFGASENGDYLLWDTASRTGDGELPVWESRRMDTLHRLGDSLAEALPALHSRARETPFCPSDHDVEPLTPTPVEQ
jgi:hypothetical protein